MIGAAGVKLCCAHARYNCLNGTCLESCGQNTTCVYTCAVLKLPQCSGLATTPVGPSGNGLNPAQYQTSHMHYSTGRTVSPLEVQLNGTLWMPAAISFNAGNTQSNPVSSNCKPGQDPPCVNGSRTAGWSEVTATAPVAIPIGCSDYCRPGQQNCVNCTSSWLITGVRYAWSENPCCGGNLDTSIVPCPVNSCPISTVNSTLPAVPFSASIVMTNSTAMGIGSCSCTPPQVCS